MTRTMLIASALIAVLGLSACANTIRGAGEDVRQSGEAVSDATRPR